MTRSYGDQDGDAPLADAEWRKGEVLDGDYLVEGLLGQGGMGVVVAARHVRTGEQVAVKLIRRERVASPAFLKRFLREASIALQLRGPHVARVLRVGHLPSGLPYLAMERLHGTTVEALLRERGRLPVATAVDYLLDACDAVAEAHALGVVHRDLKPGNLFLTTGPSGEASVKVIDFGISKWTTEPGAKAEPQAGVTTAPIGSPSYMSPEQLSEVAVADPRSDVWALGVILCELVTGRLPFEGESVATVQVHILCNPAPSLRAFDPSLPAGLDAIYQRCVIKDRASRMPNVHDLVVALAPYASANGRVLAERIAARKPLARTTMEGEVLIPPATDVPAAAAPGGRAKIALAVAGVAVALGGAGLLGAARRGARRADAARPAAAAPAAAPVAAPRAAPPPVVPPSSAVAKAPAPQEPAAQVSRVRVHPSRKTGAAPAPAPTPAPAPASTSEDSLFSTRR